jgi:hypothetical protein
MWQPHSSIGNKRQPFPPTHTKRDNHMATYSLRLLRAAIKMETQLMADCHHMLLTDQGQWYNSDPKA